MFLYKATVKSFIDDIKNISSISKKNIVVDKLIGEFKEQFRRNPEDGEVRSWENSLKEISQVFDEIGLIDQVVFLEFQLPLSSKRMDCMVVGEDANGIPQAVVIELKQWQSCEKTLQDDYVKTKLSGTTMAILHPSIQVKGYLNYLRNSTDIFNQEIKLTGCAYLHNYTLKYDDPLKDSKFEDVIKDYNLFTKDSRDKFKDFITSKVSYGIDNLSVSKIVNLKLKASKKLNENLVDMINGDYKYVLLDEQKITFDRIKSFIDSERQEKKVIIVNGGPGCGKTLIALNILSYCLKRDIEARYSTGSKYFTCNLRATLDDDVHFNYFSDYKKDKKNKNYIIDVLICDEAHRIRDKKQIKEMFEVPKVIIFFIDKNQSIRKDEIGSPEQITESIKEYEKNNKCKIISWEAKLKAQFRCGGMSGFVSWIDNTLEIEKTANILWKSTEKNFDFKICSSAKEVENLIRDKGKKGYSARIVAGQCWDWKHKQDKDNILISDIKIGEFEMPWNPYKTNNTDENIPPEILWPTDPRGINQVGCVYSAQGFEFDYVGVIFAEDLYYKYNSTRDKGNWLADSTKSRHSAINKYSNTEILTTLKKIYRVLLTRGIKGCYVYFMDKDTEEFFRSRMEI